VSKGEPGNQIMKVSVLTHQDAQKTSAVLEKLLAAAKSAGVKLVFSHEEVKRHGLEETDVVSFGQELATDLCVVLGGDGAILKALRATAGSDTPVFAINFGEIGFLATAELDDLDNAFRAAFAGQFESLELPAIELKTSTGDTYLAINDISIHRRHGARIARLAYAISGEEVGRVRCDGLVVATAAGSTGYNLANGGPVMAWGVEGYVVSFIAPHSLTARALVVAPQDCLTINNAAEREPVEIHIDGAPQIELTPGDAIDISFKRSVSKLAQLPGATFYQRMRDKFGKLAS